ncbi:uncharacterized protein N7482_007815 [Penicillium canariense]|uniref:Uncharacterized protein n=1 Tax=Penicillium canariense TaxID=189055 RepID=A0A9W9HZS0_9EURO|nr:uncharacterized protein N7482_007815 [Penicillium canariense]KAJ5160811.1 hypothetical protein N7482_007815 [Penicillium canariense]
MTELQASYVQNASQTAISTSLPSVAPVQDTALTQTLTQLVKSICLGNTVVVGLAVIFLLVLYNCSNQFFSAMVTLPVEDISIYVRKKRLARDALASKRDAENGGGVGSGGGGDDGDGGASAV